MPLKKDSNNIKSTGSLHKRTYASDSKTRVLHTDRSSHSNLTSSKMKPKPAFKPAGYMCARNEIADRNNYLLWMEKYKSKGFGNVIGPISTSNLNHKNMLISCDYTQWNLRYVQQLMDFYWWVIRWGWNGIWCGRVFIGGILYRECILWGDWEMILLFGCDYRQVNVSFDLSRVFMWLEKITNFQINRF